MNQENCQQLSFLIFRFTQKRQNFPSLLFWTKQNHGCHKSGPFFAQQGEMARSIQLSVHYVHYLATIANSCAFQAMSAKYIHLISFLCSTVPRQLA